MATDVSLMHDRDLTQLPCLTGLKPDATTDGESLSESYTLDLTLSEARSATERDGSQLERIFEQAWGSLLARLTGESGKVRFLSSNAANDDGSIWLCNLDIARVQKDTTGNIHSSLHRTELKESRHSEGMPSPGTHMRFWPPANLTDGTGAQQILRKNKSLNGECDLTIDVTAEQEKLSLCAISPRGSKSLDKESARLVLQQLGRALCLLASKSVSGFNEHLSDLPDSLFSISKCESQHSNSSEILHSPFERFANSDTSNVALEFWMEDSLMKGKAASTWTYRELNAEAERLAGRILSELEGVFGSIVPICMDRCPEIYIAILGILKAGCAWCPIDPSFPSKRRHDLIQRTGTNLIVVTASSPSDGIPEGVRSLNMSDTQSEISKPSGFKAPALSPTNLAYLIWTSGTTGAPKGVPISHAAASAAMTSLHNLIPPPSHSTSDVSRHTQPARPRTLQFSAFTFDVFIQDLFYTFSHGGTLIASTRAIMLSSFGRLAAASGATHAHLTPAFGASIPEPWTEHSGCAGLEVVTMIGEKLGEGVAEAWSKGRRKLYNTYGPAEATVVALLRQVREREKMQSANVGWPMRGTVSAHVLDRTDAKTPVLKGGVGELALGGVQLASGYWRDDIKSREKFVWNERLGERVYMTGDVVRQLHDGSFEFVGREDDLVKVQGIRIELSEIAYALRGCDRKVGQIEVAYLERSDRPSKVIVSFLACPNMGAFEGVLVNDAAVEVSRAASQVAKEELPDYMIPHFFIVVSEIPRTSSAKTDRAKLKHLYESLDLKDWERKMGLSPSGELDMRVSEQRQRIIVQTIAELTRTTSESITADSPLSSIGIDSITATRLATSLCGRGMRISVANVLQCRTIGELLLVQDEKRDLTNHFDVNVFNEQALPGLKEVTDLDVDFVMPALPLQEALLSESIKNPAAYWSHNVYALQDTVDLDRLHKAWLIVAERLEILRISFIHASMLEAELEIKNTFLQVRHSSPSLDWTVVEDRDSNEWPPLSVKDRVAAICDNYALERYVNAPWAITIFIGQEQTAMMVSIHHSIRDEASLDLIMQQLLMAYDAPSSSGIEREWTEAVSKLIADSEQVKSDEVFWSDCLESFAGEEKATWPELRLSTDSPVTCKYIWPSKMTYSDLQRESNEAGAQSVASFLRVLWSFLLLEYLETDKILVGETWSLRGEEATLTNTIGPLMSVLPVPVKRPESLRQAILQDADFQQRRKGHHKVHPQYVRKVLKRGDGGPLYHAIFNFMPDSEERQNAENCQLWHRIEEGVGLTVEHAIAFNVSLQSDGYLGFELIASGESCDETHLALLARQIDGILAGMPQNADQQGSKLIANLFPASICAGDNDISRINPVSQEGPCDWVDRYAEQHPSWVAAEVVSYLDEEHYVSQKWTYEELKRAYRNVASMISAAGHANKMIGVCLDRRLEVYACLLAIMYTGNTYLPIAEDLPEERKRFLLGDSDAVLLLTTSLVAPSFGREADRCPSIIVDELDMTKTCDFSLVPRVSPTDNSYLLYTSGSTGTPKGVLVSRGNLSLFIDAISLFISSHVDMPSLAGQGKWLGQASHAFDVHLLEMVFPWRHGMSTVTAPRSLLLDNLELTLQQLKITHASFVPSLVDNAGLHPDNLPGLRYMSVGGEPITKKAIDIWSASHVCLANAYGPTEMTIGCCFRRVASTTNLRNIGLPLAYTNAHVLRFGETEHVLRGTSGELCFTGDLVANGYHKRPDAKGFVSDFQGHKMYRTGDRVRMMADGSLEFLGRVDDQTKIRGQRIELGEVTEIVRGIACRSFGSQRIECAVIVAKHPILARPQLVAFLAIDSFGSKDLAGDTEIVNSMDNEQREGIRLQCEKTMPAFMVPEQIIQLNRLPLVTVSRKIDTRRLRSLFDQRNQSTSRSGKIPSNARTLNENEDLIATVAAAKLCMQKHALRADSNLFEFGLDSLNAIGLTIELQKRGLSCSVACVLKEHTIERISAVSKSVASPAQHTKRLSPSRELERRFRATGQNGHDLSMIETVRPCLPLQATLLASSLSHEKQALYVNHVLLDLGDGDPHRTAQSFERVADRFEILRTCFTEFEKTFVQLVLKRGVQSVDVRWGNGEDYAVPDDSKVRHEVAQDIIENLESSPPWRLTFSRSSSGARRTTLLVSLHHALYDADSFAMIMNEVFCDYNELQSNTIHASMTELIDYVGTRNQKASETFWSTYLSGYEPTLFELSTASESETQLAKLEVPLSSLGQLAVRLGVTTPSLMQILFGVALAETHGVHDITFGVVLSGRTVPVEKADTILAPCITTIPQRVFLASTTDLKRVVEASHKGVPDSLEYQHTALKDIHRWVHANKPLFDVLFSYNKKKKNVEWQKMYKEIDIYMPSEFPLAVEINADPSSDEVALRCDFTEAFGSQSRAQSLINRYQALIQSLFEGKESTLRPVSGKLTEGNLATSDRGAGLAFDKDADSIRNVVAEVLDITPSNIANNESFFALGIDSIIALDLAKRCKGCGLDCSSVEIMRYPSVQELASQLSLKQSKAQTASNRSRESALAASQLPEEVHRLQSITYSCPPLQSSMLTQTLASDGTLYVHHYAMRLKQGVRMTAMIMAWERIAEQNEILRTGFYFSPKDKQWMGQVKANTCITCYDFDLSMDLLQATRKIDARMGYSSQDDFGRPPWSMATIGDIFVLSMHHALYDGESFDMMLQDCSDILEGKPACIRPAFSVAAQAIAGQGEGAEQYWSEKVAQLPGAPRRASTVPYSELTMDLDLDLAETLSACRRLGVTLQTLALVAYGKTLSGSSKKNAVVFGHIVNRRSIDVPNADKILGPMFNTVPIHIDFLQSNVTNQGLSQQMQRMTGESQACQMVSLADIQNLWRSQNKDADYELFDSLFTFQKKTSVAPERPWTSVVTEYGGRPTEYSTNFELQQKDGSLSVTANSIAVSDLKDFIQRFAQLLQEICEEPQAPASAFLGNIPRDRGGPMRLDPTGHMSENGVLEPCRPSTVTIKKVRRSLAHTSGISEDAIQENTSIFSLGLDSISAIQAAAQGRKIGISLAVADVLQGRTLIGICQKVEARSHACKNRTQTKMAANTLRQGAQKSDELDERLKDKALQAAGVRSEDVEAVVPGLAGQLYQLAIWLRSGRNLGEATWTFSAGRKLDPTWFPWAWHTLRMRHPVLRTILATVSETQAMQVVLKPGAIRSDALQIIDLDPQLDESAAIRTVVRTLSRQRFDLFSPAVQLTILSGKSKDFVILKLHHVLYDAWSIDTLVNDLQRLYLTQNGAAVSRVQPTVPTESLELSRSESARNYWTKSLSAAEPTILLSSSLPDSRPQAHLGHSFLEESLPKFTSLEATASANSTSFSTIILLATSRVLARCTSISSPTFGFFQAGRSATPDPTTSDETGPAAPQSSTQPLLNLLPLTIPNAQSSDPTSLITDLSSDLAERVPFEQTYLHDILQWTNNKHSPLFNTFINIIMPTTDSTKGIESETGEIEPLLTRWPGEGDVGVDAEPSIRLPGKTAVDGLGLAEAFLEEGNIFIDVVREKERLRFITRYDDGVFTGREEAKGFLKDIISEIEGLVRMLDAAGDD